MRRKDRGHWGRRNCGDAEGTKELGVTRTERRRRGWGDTWGDRKRKATGDISYFLCDVDLE